MARLKPPLTTITFMGMMFNSSNADLKHFFRATKSPTSFVYVARRLAAHIWELFRYGRGIAVTSGNALAARLASRRSTLTSIPILTGSPAKALLREGDRVVGVRAGGEGGDCEIRAKYGVVLACGGFPHDEKRIAKAYPHLARGGEHVSPTPVGNTGDGLNMAEAAGASVDIRFADTSAWMPVSRVPYRNGEVGVFPHLLDRYKPGVIGVLKNGSRFTNGSDSYHDVGAALIRACDGQRETAMWLICDKPTLAKYGLGYAKPSPVPAGPLLRSGYLLQGATIAELAAAGGHRPRGAGDDGQGLQRWPPSRGDDPAFGRGPHFVQPLSRGPRQQAQPLRRADRERSLLRRQGRDGRSGEPSTESRAAWKGEVLRSDGSAIEGLYAVGNDRASIMGGNYPCSRHHARPQHDVRVRHRQRHRRQSGSQNVSPVIKPIVDHRIYTIRLRKMAEFISTSSTGSRCRSSCARSAIPSVSGRPGWVRKTSSFTSGVTTASPTTSSAAARATPTPTSPPISKLPEHLIEAQETRDPRRDFGEPRGADVAGS